jgi:hypothetical protein
MKLEVTVGTPVTRGGMSLYPLFSNGPAAGGYLTGPQAAAAGVIEVTELDDGAEVPELRLVNAAQMPVLLVEGEMLLGGKQNRTLNLSVLCAQGVVTNIPVSCVEAGRWGQPQAESRSAHHANVELRRAKTVSTIRHERMGAGKVSDQGAVWEEVDAQLCRLACASPSAALEDAFTVASELNRPRLDDVRPTPGQVGVVAVIGGAPVAVDLFDKPETLDAYWEAIISGYALDGLDADEKPTDALAVQAFVDQLDQVVEEPVRAVGLGDEIHFESDQVAGAALMWDDVLVHLSAYSLAGMA